MNTMTPMHDRIVDATLSCMRECGVRGTTTKAIARQAGVSEGSIYNHFGNRSELIVRAFAAATQTIRQRAQGLEHLVGQNTVATNLTSLAVAVIEFFRDLNPVVGSILGDPELRAWFTDGEIQGLTDEPLTPLNGVLEVASYLEREHAAGRVPFRGPWPIVAATLIGACQHYSYLEMLTPGGIQDAEPDLDISPRAYARAVVRTVLDE